MAGWGDQLPQFAQVGGVFRDRRLGELKLGQCTQIQTAGHPGPFAQEGGWFTS